MQWKFTILMCSIFSVPAPAANQQAGTAEILSLEEAIKTALVHHPRLRRAQLEVAKAEARIEQAGSTYFPQVDTGGTAKQGLSGSGNLFGLHGLASSPEPDDMAISVNVYQDVYDFGRTKHESAARSHELVYFTESTLAEKAEVILRVQRAYYSALKAKKLIEVAEKTVEERRLTLRQAEAFYRAQLRSKLDVTLAQVGLFQAELALVRANNALDQAFAALNNAMGLDRPRGVYTLEEPDIEMARPPLFEDLLEEGLENRPELRAIEARIMASEEWVERAESDRYPKFMGLFSGGWTRFADLTLGKVLFGGFGIRLPIFTGGRLKANIEEAKQNLEETKAARDELIQNIQFQLRKAYNDFVTSIESVKTSEHIVEQAKESVRLARIRYEVELADFLELMVAQTSLTAAESEHAQALYDYKITESELQYAAGKGELGLESMK